MPEDRLRHDADEVKDLEDIIEAHDEGTSHLARDIDVADIDFDIPEDIDVDDALTFPHPKHKKDPNEDVELMDTPRKGDVDIDWAASQQDMLPSDYTDDYDDALTTNLKDEDEVAEDQIEEISSMGAEDLIYNTAVVTEVPSGSGPVEGPSGEEGTPPVELGRHPGRLPGEMESAMATGTDVEDFSGEPEGEDK